MWFKFEIIWFSSLKVMAVPSWVPEIGALCFSGTEPGTLFK